MELAPPGVRRRFGYSPAIRPPLGQRSTPEENLMRPSQEWWAFVESEFRGCRERGCSLSGSFVAQSALCDNLSKKQHLVLTRSHPRCRVASSPFTEAHLLKVTILGTCMAVTEAMFVQ